MARDATSRLRVQTPWTGGSPACQGFRVRKLTGATLSHTNLDLVILLLSFVTGFHGARLTLNLV